MFESFDRFASRVVFSIPRAYIGLEHLYINGGSVFLFVSTSSKSNMFVMIPGGLSLVGLGGGVGTESLTIGAENSAVQISDVTVYQVDAGTDFRKKVSCHN